MRTFFKDNSQRDAPSRSHGGYDYMHRDSIETSLPTTDVDKMYKKLAMIIIQKSKKQWWILINRKNK